MKRQTTNFGHSVRTRLLALANRQGVQLEIKKEDKYPGVRVTFCASIGGARVNLQCDVGFGDSVYPTAETMRYPALLDTPAPHVKVYPRYTVVAEKFQIMVSRGLLNSRLKDYYDLWVLSNNFEFDQSMLRIAVERTFGRRDTAVPTSVPEALSTAFSDDPIKQTQWRAFLKKSGIEFVELSAVAERLREFLAPIWTIR